MHKPSRPVLVAYLSGHGYGHFTRSQAVLERLTERASVHLRTSGQALRLARRTAGFASLEEVDVGPGVAQHGPLVVDLPATLRALAAHVAELPRLAEREARALSHLGATAVFADVPPLAFAAAARAGLPSVGLSNFSWSWIYQGYAHHDPAFAAAAAVLAAAEARCTRMLALAGGGGLEHCGQVVPIAPVVRRPRLPGAEVRRRLGLDDGDGRPLALLSFGGFGDELDLARIATGVTRLRLLLVSGPPGLRLPHARSIEPDGALTHPDLVAACDCLVGKPGYGTVAECLHRPTALVHVPRGEFREYPALVAFIERYLPQAPLSKDELLAGRLEAAVERALQSRPPAPPPPGDGIAEAVAELAAVLGLPAGRA